MDYLTEKDEMQWREENVKAFFWFALVVIVAAVLIAKANGWTSGSPLSVVVTLTIGLLGLLYKDSIENQATRTTKFDADAFSFLALYETYTQTENPTFLATFRFAYLLSTLARNLNVNCYYPRHFRRIIFFTEDALKRLEHRTNKFSRSEELLIENCLSDYRKLRFRQHLKVEPRQP